MLGSVLILIAWTIEATFGWPDWLFKRVGHPVVWMGGMINALSRSLNRETYPHSVRYILGAISSLICLLLVVGLAWAISALLPNNYWGICVEALLASSLIASRSLYDHVAAILKPLSAGDIAGARYAVSMIVGRDPEKLDEAGIARASLESLAENTSDGVVAPLFWGVIFGLPGIATYKAVNTLDSMIGHKSDTYLAFGGFAARLDDLVNLVPARLTGLLFAVASFSKRSFIVMLRDARSHRSPNAGWPEAAMAGALNVRVSGPRIYGTHTAQEPWLNPESPDPDARKIRSGLHLFLTTMALLWLIILGLAILRVSVR